MEQQDQVQSVMGEWAQETTELSINDVTAPYEFRGGLYYCEGLEGGYTSIDLLRRAWATKVKEEKIREARINAAGLGNRTVTPAAKAKARKEYVKWHKTQV